MSENHVLENEPEQDPLDNERRSMLKKAACTIGAAYIAPATLNLLLADKASAASGPGGGGGGAGGEDPPLPPF